MKAYLNIICGLAFIMCLPSISFADKVGPNAPHIAKSKDGACYAKSVPTESYGGQKGVTKIYLVDQKQDQLVVTYDWYSNQIYLDCHVCSAATGYVGEGLCGISVVRLGPWHLGNKPNANDLAIVFYLNNKLLKEYSTLDIAKDSKNASISASHYSVIREIVGYGITQSGVNNNFTIKTYDGRELSFNAATGELNGSR